MAELKRHFTGQFRKDLKLAKKRGKNTDKLKPVMSDLNQNKPLDPKYKDHKLTGNYVARRECHIEPDWLLIYKVDLNEETIVYERTGSHSDLF